MTCPDCGGSGFMLDCCDDICIGAGECIHGDGEVVCETRTNGEPLPFLGQMLTFWLPIAHQPGGTQ